MSVIVVYESMYGNTEAIAYAIASGIGEGTRVLTTTEATPPVIATARFVIAGAPVHALSLPSAATRTQAAASPIANGAVTADVAHPMMRDWLATIPPLDIVAAAFDTRVRGPLGRGASTAIGKGFTAAGWRLLAKPRGFYVNTSTGERTRGGLLREGELDEARAWGAQLALLASELAE